MAKRNPSSLAQPSSRPLAADEPVSRGLPLWGTWQLPGLGPAAIVLLALTLVTFSNSFFGGLVLDNGVIIGDDIRLREFSSANLWYTFAENYWWPSLASDLYRPLTTLSYMVNYSLIGGGADPKLAAYPVGSILPEGVSYADVQAATFSLVGFHVVNMLLHWINSLLVFALIRRIVPSAWAALFGACIFAVHPVVVESVTNIVGRADLLATMCVLIALVLHIRAYQVRGIQRAVAIVGMGLVALAGVFCKENAIVIVGAMPLYDLAFASENADRRRWHVLWERFSQDGWMHYVAVAPALIALFTARYVLMQYSPVFAQVGVDNPIAAASFVTGKMTAIKVVANYLGILLWPATLSCDYSHHQIHLFEWGESPQDWLFFVGMAITVGTAAAGIMAYVKRWRSFFFLGFFIGAFLPTSNLLITIGTIMAERILYLPMVGFAGFAAVVAFWVSRRLRNDVFAQRPDVARAILAGLAALMIVGMAARSYAANEAWFDEDRLWVNAMAACPDSFKVYKGLALVRAKADAVTMAGLQSIQLRAQAIVELLTRSNEALRKAERRPASLPDAVGPLTEARPQCKIIQNASGVFLDQIAFALERASVIGLSIDSQAATLRHDAEATMAQAEQLDKLIGQILALLASGDIEKFSQSRKLMDQALEQAPKLAQLTTSMTTEAAEMNSLLLEHEIIPMAERGYQVLRDNPLPLIHLPGQLYLDLGHYYASMGDRAAIEQPDKPPANSDEAVAWYGKAIKILREGEAIDKAVNEGSRRTRMLRGVSEREIIDVGNPSVYHDLGVVYMRLGDFKQAYDAFQYQLKLDPLSNEAYYNSGVSLAMLQQFQPAALDLITSLILGNKGQEAWAHLYKIYDILAPEPRAIQQNDNRFSLNVNNPVVRDHVNQAFYKLIEALIRTKRFDEARTMRTIAVKQFACPEELFGPLDLALARIR